MDSFLSPSSSLSGFQAQMATFIHSLPVSKDKQLKSTHSWIYGEEFPLSATFFLTSPFFNMFHIKHVWRPISRTVICYTGILKAHGVALQTYFLTQGLLYRNSQGAWCSMPLFLFEPWCLLAQPLPDSRSFHLNLTFPVLSVHPIAAVLITRRL